MLLIPAISLKDGKVLASNGKSSHAARPEELVKELRDAGMTRLHLLDVPSQNEGLPGELAAIERIANALDGITLQVDTGIKDEESVQSYMDAGVHWVVLGKRAASTPHVLKDLCLEFPGHVMYSLNVRDRHPVSESHSKLSNHDIVDLAQHFQEDGVDGLVYQEVDEKEHPASTDVPTIKDIAGGVSIDLFVAGLIESLDDIAKACELGDAGVTGIVVSNPLDKGIDYAEAMRLVEDAS
ncbi:MAG: HisA/HisF-related TIM barrel protein [Gammaproteobacteria bacterium]|nr:HisA/HisF-related TIM barrel protein [Gammaproteobacteria bacterium]